MASRGRTTFQKRQKEMARKERQQRKAERRENRRTAREVEDKTPPQDPPETADGEQDESLQQRPDWRPGAGDTNL
jgi:hypothetical protein